MAIDSFVDSTKLDNSLTATADAIRSKTGSSTPISFDYETETGFSSAIGTIPSGGTINGAQYDCGEFTPDADITTSKIVSHALGVVPSVVFLWVCDPSYSSSAIIGKFRSDSTSYLNSVSITAINGGISTGNGANNSAFRTAWSSSTITFYCNSTYKLIAGYRYQWLAIGTQAS